MAQRTIAILALAAFLAASPEVEARAVSAAADSSALIKAVASGNSGELRLLIEAGVNLDARNAAGDTALHVAAKQGNADVARMLIEAGSDPKARNAAGLTALRLAEHQGRVVVARALRGQ